MTILNAIIQGAVQGLTEFLPISSSGHLSLIQHFTGQSGESGLLFTILLHLGTLLAVFIAFRGLLLDLIVEVFFLLGDLFRGRFSWRNANPNRRMILLLLVSLLPMAVSFLLLDVFDAVSSDQDIIVEGICFLFTSLLLFLSDRASAGRKTAQNMTFGDAAVIGAVQAVAPFPGISRSGSTIAAGVFMGLERRYAVSFSFIMGVPTVLGANLLELRDVAAEGLRFPVPVLVAGMAAALVFGLAAIKMVNWLVASNKFKYFAWYTLFLGLAVIGIGIYERTGGTAVRALILSALG